jgi:hypothetical protein
MAGSSTTSLDEYRELVDRTSLGHLPRLMQLLELPDNRRKSHSERRLALQELGLEQIAEFDIAKWNAWVDEENAKLAESTARQAAGGKPADVAQARRDERHKLLLRDVKLYRE